MPGDPLNGGPAIPLSRWADRQLRMLAAETGSPAIATLNGATLLGERAALGGYTIPGLVSAGLGGSRLLPTRDHGWFALTLMRREDRELLPALFGDAVLPFDDDNAIAAAVLRHDCADLLARGRELGLPVASADETPASPAAECMTRGATRHRPPGHRPLVVDLSSIWAGPLAGHLLWLAGAQVIKVESLSRPDLIRHSDPAMFGLINQGKASVVVDFASEAQKASLTVLIRQADLVIESSRPRALRHLGIDADALVREVPGLVWLSITGHGATGEAANWTGIGNDCGVAGGLSRALTQASGAMGYLGDAIADPLTGIVAMREGWNALAKGEARRIGVAMSAVAARALTEERAHDRAALERELRAWSAAKGLPFPPLAQRPLTGEVRPFGADTQRYLPDLVSC